MSKNSGYFYKRNVIMWQDYQILDLHVFSI